MSVKVMGLVWDAELPKQEKFVLLAYADHAGHNGENIFPAVATMCRKTGFSDRSIQKITKRLLELKILERNGYGMNGTNKYNINLDVLSGFIPPEHSSPPKEIHPEQISAKPLSSNKNTTYSYASELRKHFSEITGIPAPDWVSLSEKERKHMGSMWNTPIKTMYGMANKDIDKTKDAMSKAVGLAKTKGFDVYTPKSIVSVFPSCLIEKQIAIVGDIV